MIQAIVTDIEGTTSSIRFVHNVLFPYAKAHIADYVRRNSKNPEVSAQLDDVATVSGIERDYVEGLIKQLIEWIEQDKKITPLKALQGMVWEHGYKHGDFTGHVYVDAVKYLKLWHQQGIKLYVYSSGSVKAQQLIFGHTEYGDLTTLFDGYFDTRIGGKRDTESYKVIAENIGVEPTGILFLSDIKEELDAAATAGMKTCWLVRSDDSDVPLEQASECYPSARTFQDVVL